MKYLIRAFKDGWNDGKRPSAVIEHFKACGLLPGLVGIATPTALGYGSEGYYAGAGYKIA